MNPPDISEAMRQLILAGVDPAVELAAAKEQIKRLRESLEWAINWHSGPGDPQYTAAEAILKETAP